MMGWLALSGAVATAVAAPSDGEAGVLDGALERYVAVALEQSPEVRAAFHRWEAAVHRVARARTLPEPTVSFGAFVRSVETRVGPQQARISVQQAFPWPTKLTRGGEAASTDARAAESMLEAVSLGVAERVALAYWTLWELRASHALHEEHLTLLDALSEAVSARLAVGGASLADLQQVDLSRARLADALVTTGERERIAGAALRAALGDRSVPDPLPTTSEPVLAALPEDDLRPAVLGHPALQALGLGADAADARARAAGANRLPGFTVGGDWIVVGPEGAHDPADSGKDAVMATVGLRIPLWQGTYAHEVAAERTHAEAVRQDQRAREDRALADLERARVEIRDSGRRVRVLTSTLIPQAEAAHASVLGTYTVGQSSVTQTLASQRDLLELGVERVAALADHQRAWARLDQLVGAEVPRGPLLEGAP